MHVTDQFSQPVVNSLSKLDVARTTHLLRPHPHIQTVQRREKKKGQQYEEGQKCIQSFPCSKQPPRGQKIQSTRDFKLGPSTHMKILADLFFKTHTLDMTRHVRPNWYTQVSARFG